MRNWKALCLCFVALLCLMWVAAPKVSAATEGDYTYEVSNGEAKITDYKTTVTGAITIPGTLGGYPVTAIGNQAFASCRVSSVIIPEGVTVIGSYAFSACSRLSSVTIPSTVTEIDTYAFNNCSKLGNITIPEGVNTIRSYILNNCSNVTSISIPASVTSLNRYAFTNCKNLTGIWVSEDNTVYSSDSFGVLFDKEKTILIKVPEKFTGAYAVPVGVTTIGARAFSSCGSLTEVTLPNGLETIEQQAFQRCGLTNVTIPDSVTVMGEYAFYGCFRLASVTIGKGLTAISTYAFNGCTKLAEVTMSNGLISIGDYAFYSCSALTELKIPDSVTAIGEDALHMCTGLTGIWVGENNTAFSSDTFGVLFDREKRTLLLAPGTIAGSYTVPKGAITVGKNAFYGRTSLTEVRIPDSVTIIDANAFKNCTGLNTVFFGKGVRSVYNNAFDGSGVSAVYYAGTKAQWSGIKIATYNSELLNATKCYNWHEGEHVYTNYLSDGNATCTEDGTKTSKCDLCEEKDTQPDPGSVLGHDWDGGIVLNEGYITYTCTRCGEKYEEEYRSENEIVTQPVPVTADSGTTAQFSVETVGAVVSYKWQYRKIWKWFDSTMDGCNTDTLTVSATGAYNGYDYRCVITFADGATLISDPAELTVNTSVTVTEHPVDKTVFLGEKAQFTASAVGEGLKYQWQYQRPNGATWFYTGMEGSTEPTVTIETTAARDGYKYRCMITDVTGNVAYSDVATMTVVTFIPKPETVYTTPGTTVTFAVSTSDNFTCLWQYTADGITWLDATMTGYNTATLYVDATEERNGYQFRCIFTDAEGGQIISTAAILHVGKPLELLDQPGNCVAIAGRTALFRVEANNVQSYQWQYQRPDSDRWCYTTMEGCNTAELTVLATSARNGYKYRCVITGTDGKTHYTDPAILTVR